MPKKKITQEESKDGVWVTAAKTIGRAAGKIASLVSGNAKTDSTGDQSSQPKRPVKKMSKPVAMITKPAQAKKATAAASGTKTTRKKSK